MDRRRSSNPAPLRGRALAFAQAMLWMAQHHAGHVELLRLRAEARSILFTVPETADTSR
jgi:hypothetical protein